MNSNESTKNRILRVSNELFARGGYAGTSIRDIADMAEVNLAAIHYHFKNKEGLYWAVFLWNYNSMESKIELLGQETNSIEDLTRAVFQLFQKDKTALMNTFKIFLSDNLNFPNDSECEQATENFGPPGQKAFLEKVKLEFGSNFSEAASHWFIKMTFSLLVHFGVVMNTQFVQMKRELGQSYDVQTVEDMLIHSVKAHLNYLKDERNSKDMPETFIGC